MVYEFLPVARLHRKIHGFPTLVILWSPTTMLRTCKVIANEAADITNKTVKRYKHTQSIGTCRHTETLDSMPRMIVDWTPEGFRHLQSMTNLIVTSLECAGYVKDTRKLLNHHAPTPAFLRSLRGQDAAATAAAWVWQAAHSVLAPKGVMGFDVAVNVSNPAAWYVNGEFKPLFVDASEQSQFVDKITETSLQEGFDNVVVLFTAVPARPGGFNSVKPKTWSKFIQSWLGFTRCGWFINNENYKAWAEAEWI
ncbi:hypothetical protein OPT61_g5410 [Boeremia exigua]|uniref:Uncharacterized protein n=1 Tax=Boeremia exigua TaxID=749465 RepID=A0ACC2IAG7_9PLEO|nr:hypothetical protein OPT61_g5410 [Boeremia exigua]